MPSCPLPSNETETLTNSGEIALSNGAPASSEFIRTAVAQLAASFPYVEPTVYSRIVTVLSEMRKSENWIRYAFRTAERTFKNTYDINVANLLSIEQTIESLTREQVYELQLARPNDDVFAEFVKMRVGGKLRYVKPEVFQAVRELFEKTINERGTVIYIPKTNN